MLQLSGAPRTLRSAGTDLPQSSAANFDDQGIRAFLKWCDPDVLDRQAVTNEKALKPMGEAAKAFEAIESGLRQAALVEGFDVGLRLVAARAYSQLLRRSWEFLIEVRDVKSGIRFAPVSPEDGYYHPIPDTAPGFVGEVVRQLFIIEEGGQQVPEELSRGNCIASPQFLAGELTLLSRGTGNTYLERRIGALLNEFDLFVTGTPVIAANADKHAILYSSEGKHIVIEVQIVAQGVSGNVGLTLDRYGHSSVSTPELLVTKLFEYARNTNLIAHLAPVSCLTDELKQIFQNNLRAAWGFDFQESWKMEAFHLLNLELMRNGALGFEIALKDLKTDDFIVPKGNSQFERSKEPVYIFYEVQHPQNHWINVASIPTTANLIHTSDKLCPSPQWWTREINSLVSHTYSSVLLSPIAQVLKAALGDRASDIELCDIFFESYKPAELPLGFNFGVLVKYIEDGQTRQGFVIVDCDNPMFVSMDKGLNVRWVFGLATK